MKVTKQVTFIAKEDSIEQLKDMLKTMVEPSKNENGCLLYDIFQLKDNLRKFVVIESWENEEALDGHKNSQHYKYYKANFEPFCEQKFSDDLDFI
ncbi:MAG: antibiotic biosynthesis monooxygenase [Arcobacter sp.]|nr:antibiotic biosynthesis monooxygenase [Arcobacter sp.]